MLTNFYSTRDSSLKHSIHFFQYLDEHETKLLWGNKFFFYVYVNQMSLWGHTSGPSETPHGDPQCHQEVCLPALQLHRQHSELPEGSPHQEPQGAALQECGCSRGGGDRHGFIRCIPGKDIYSKIQIQPKQLYWIQVHNKASFIPLIFKLCPTFWI